ncbi:Uncharacterised protein [uncultured archaeon]|nr:Uncharacterised protein [uncultured archaeon]
MALQFDIDIYNTLLSEILKVNPTGDPVNDAVYLVLLPMVVLYMYCDYVITRSRFGGDKGQGKFKVIMMFIVGFIIVREGFYPIFAGFSLPLLIIIMVFHAGGFILRGRTENTSYQRGTGGESSGSTLGSLLLKKSGLSGAIAAANPMEMEDARNRLRNLNAAWRATVRLLGTSNLQNLPPDNELRKILTEAIDAIDRFNPDTRKELIKNLEPSLKKELEDLYK